MSVLSLLLFLMAGDAQRTQAAQPAKPASIPAGTRLDARLESSVKTGSSEIGDNVVAILMKPLRLADKVVIPRGSRLNGRVETIEPATRIREGRVRLVFREIELPDGRRFPAWVTNAFEASPRKRGLRYALLMSAGGAGGALIGGKKARVAGILGGLLAGFVIAGTGADSNLPDLTLHPGQTIHLQLGEDLTVPQQK